MQDRKQGKILKSLLTLNKNGSLNTYLKSLDWKKLNQAEESLLNSIVQERDFLGMQSNFTDLQKILALALGLKLLNSDKLALILVKDVKDLLTLELQFKKIFSGSGLKLLVLKEELGISHQLASMRLGPQIIISLAPSLEAHLKRASLDISKISYFIINDFRQLFTKKQKFLNNLLKERREDSSLVLLEDALNKARLAYISKVFKQGAFFSLAKDLNLSISYQAEVDASKHLHSLLKSGESSILIYQTFKAKILKLQAVLYRAKFKMFSLLSVKNKAQLTQALLDFNRAKYNVVLADKLKDYYKIFKAAKLVFSFNLSKDLILSLNKLLKEPESLREKRIIVDFSDLQDILNLSFFIPKKEQDTSLGRAKKTRSKSSLAKEENLVQESEPYPKKKGYKFYTSLSFKKKKVKRRGL